VKSRKKNRVGTVVANKMDKTITVSVERQFAHPLYKKIIKKSKNFLVHDESNQARVGDKVRIVESRPLSKRKRWKLVEIIEKAR